MVGNTAKEFLAQGSEVGALITNKAVTDDMVFVIEMLWVIISVSIVFKQYFKQYLNNTYFKIYEFNICILIFGHQSAPNAFKLRAIDLEKQV